MVLYNKMGGLSKIEFTLDMSLVCMYKHRNNDQRRVK
jgi:hypothetical protein